MRNRQCLFIALLVISRLVVVAQPTPPPGVSAAKFHLYLLAGQSNMAGRGTVEAIDATPHPRVWMLNRDNQWVPAIEPLHFDKPGVVGVGPGLAFGKLMAAEDTTVFIGLIPTAVGGSAIDSWQPEGYHEQTKSYPYNDAIRRGQLAQKTGTIRGVLWHQGESDSKPELMTTYEPKLVQLVERFRREFNAPTLPVVVGTLGDFYVAKNPSAATINTVLYNLPKRVLRIVCVAASGLTDKGDQTHFDAASARELGRRYAEAMQKLQATK